MQTQNIKYKAEVIEEIQKTPNEVEIDGIYYKLKILEKDKEGREVEVYSNGFDYSPGDKVFIENVKYDEGSEYYNLQDYIRYDSILISLFIFLLVIVSIFGKKGVKALASLLASFVVIFFILIPLTLKGYNPVFVASGISLLLLSALMLITNGRNKITYAALLGSFVSVFITIIISYVLVINSKFTGFVDDTSSYLFYSVDQPINFTLLLIASMIIGLIGVIDDGSITQASTVAELKKANGNLADKEYYKRAMSVGSHHAGAMINTLILAYMGASLQLVLFLYLSAENFWYLVNKEIVATEIIRALIGSSGLLLAIPLTTYFAVKLIKKEDLDSDNFHAHSHSHNH